MNNLFLQIKFGHVNPKTIENENSQLYLVSATLPRSLDSILENVITVS